jgi:glycosyltransferase involved in cell wall biosynthesis
MVVLEAMAAGVPVVAANVGGVPDLITEGQTGLFCDPLNEASMRMAVQKLLDDHSLASSLADRAQTAGRQRFHPKAIASRHIEIYREVLNAKN